MPRHRRIRPGDLISYKDRPGIVITKSRHPGWMDRIEVVFSDGSTDWFWIEDTDLKSHLH